MIWTEKLNFKNFIFGKRLFVAEKSMLKTILIRYPKPYLIKFIYDPLIISQLDLFDSKIEFPATLRMLAPDVGDKNSSPTSI